MSLKRQNKQINTNGNTIGISRHHVLLYWLLLAGLILFGLIVLFDMGILQRILGADVTRITAVIFVFFGLGCCHCGYRSWFISHQFNHLLSIQGALVIDRASTLPSMQPSLALNYLNAIQQEKPVLEPSQQAELLAESIRGAHKVGWFVVGILVKLGLLGTVIGFVMMLGTVSDIDNIDVSSVKQLMQQMTQGMGIAMYTTMFGLIGSMLLGAQYLFLDRWADRFISQTLALSDSIDTTPAHQQDTERQNNVVV